MKITANRKEEVLRRKAEYDAAMKAYNDDWETRRRNYQAAEREVLNPIEDTLNAELSKFSLLQFDVSADFNFGSLVEVRISCNEHSKFDDSVALAWSYEALLDPSTGELKRNTSSWSGMQATTRAQLDSLKQSVDALEYLLTVDWASLLNVQQPDYDKYFEGRLARPEHQDFKSELIEAELAECVGTNTLVKVHNFDSSGYGGRTVYVRIVRETPSQYVVNVLTEWTIENIRSGQSSLDNRYEQRVKKSKLDPVIENGELVTITI